ncbi:MAG: hypothetical protein LBT37_02030 [Lactobacillaceae bacterium]|jgi:hypothetical protein|nr:hypothetical protein [Lactobacillaceae bacterium]
MFTQINTRKAFAIGAMGLLLGSTVIPATVSAAELVSPSLPAAKVTNPGNIVNDDNTFYDKYEWYNGTNMVQPACFESGHYTKSLDSKSHYTFEVKNDTDKKISFLPAIDLVATPDYVYSSSTTQKQANSGPGWAQFNTLDDIPNKWEVAPRSTKVVTVPNLNCGDLGIKRGLYVYLYGLGKNESTAGINYRIYKGDAKTAVTPNNELNYQIVSGNKDGNSYLNAHNDVANNRKYNVDGVVDLELDGRVDDKYLYNFPNTLISPAKLEATLAGANSNSIAKSLAWADIRDGHPFSKEAQGGKIETHYDNAPWIRAAATEYPAPYEIHHYLRLHLDQLQVPENAAYVQYTFKASDGVFLHDTILKIPVSWTHVNDK